MVTLLRKSNCNVFTHISRLAGEKYSVEGPKTPVSILTSNLAFGILGLTFIRSSEYEPSMCSLSELLSLSLSIVKDEHPWSLLRLWSAHLLTEFDLNYTERRYWDWYELQVGKENFGDRRNAENCRKWILYRRNLDAESALTRKLWVQSEQEA